MRRDSDRGSSDDGSNNKHVAGSVAWLAWRAAAAGGSRHPSLTSGQAGETCKLKKSWRHQCGSMAWHGMSSICLPLPLNSSMAWHVDSGKHGVCNSSAAALVL